MNQKTPLCFDDIKSVVDTYVGDIRAKQINREKAWEICYSQFYHARQQNSCDYDYLSLHLSSYLACWGMFRNSFLLNTNYKIHIEPVSLIMQSEYDSLCGIRCSDYAGEMSKLEKLIVGLKDIYTSSREEIYEIAERKIPYCDISDTLVSKVLLGTLACVPAYDRYGVTGMSIDKISPIKLSIESIKSIIRCFENTEFDKLEVSYADESVKIPYPQMKIVDMYYFAKGNQKEHNKELMKAL
ncbi:MAG: hypothetical protein K6G84_12425 [Lachnospiraceae bacterium]|nr:hypothetical protein [Lachnospiraceae bacterium]